jgi:hypothetical protein
VETALRMSIQRFGRQLTINGTEEFRRQAIEITAAKKLDITFIDPDMEKRKLALTMTPHESVPDACALYITERNMTRSKGIDMLPHRRYADSDAGQHSFAGLRNVEGQTLMLLQPPSEMLVIPIDDNRTLKRAHRLKIGSPVDMDKLGLVLARGRKIP